ncbi:hypothetical protein [Streptomyces sp. VB1]|uniref:hypothetical protein n=1 Tax=Streptomyces sp. VB1 TaxID=2986803 RepID=UPI002241B86A|nr:hypothetical protein [Streptomyces sp. VB1]UZI32406.1 hypothetical protein OH133_32335 [Streptomyces sp. VB1]
MTMPHPSSPIYGSPSLPSARHGREAVTLLSLNSEIVLTSMCQARPITGEQAEAEPADTRLLMHFPETLLQARHYCRQHIHSLMPKIFAKA